MRTASKFLIPLSFLTGGVGAAAGYALHTSPHSVAPTCSPAAQIERMESNADPLGLSGQPGDPALATSSWTRWPSVTDF